jgi:hypothetical protein
MHDFKSSREFNVNYELSKLNSQDSNITSQFRSLTLTSCFTFFNCFSLFRVFLFTLLAIRTSFVDGSFLEKKIKSLSGQWNKTMLYKVLSLFIFPIVMLVLQHLFSHKTHYLLSVETGKVEITVIGKNV